MKDRIIMFVIGVLVGAVIATGAFYLYTSNSENNQNTMMEGNMPPDMPGNGNGQPPEKPDGENGEPPEKPNGENDSMQTSNENND